MNRLPRRELGIALVCCGLLMMEICLTKIFSIVLWYHFGFLAVSTALLGFASSGVYLTLQGRRLTGEAVDGAIAGSAAVAAVATVASLWLVTQTSFDVYSLVADRTVGTLFAFVLWVTLPFFFLGLVVARTLSAFPERVNWLYGADLVGSAGGCALAVWVLNAGLSGQQAILIAAVLVGLGGLLFAGRQRAVQARGMLALLVPLLTLLFVDVDSVFVLRSPKSKPYSRVESLVEERRQPGESRWLRGKLRLEDGEDLEVESPYPLRLSEDQKSALVYTDDGPREVPLSGVRRNKFGLPDFEAGEWSPFRRWSSLARVDAFHWPAVYGPWGLWGLSSRFAEDGVAVPRQKGITIDAWAMTSIMRYSGKPLQPAGDSVVDAEREKLRILEYLPAGTVHHIKKDIGSIVCLGAGGGLDILTAKYYGAKRIIGVEINPGVVQAAREAFPEFAGHLYDQTQHPDVEIHVAEGRHFLERSKESYDVIQLSGVDTFSTTEAGAFSLSENYLYTVEAFLTFLRHLREGGVLTLTRWFYPDIQTDQLQLRASLRLLGLARKSLQRFGTQKPQDAVFFLKSHIFTVILIKPDGFTLDEARALRDHCKDYRFDVLYTPHAKTPMITVAGRSYPNDLQGLMDSADPDGFLADQSFDVTPPVDDRPFFFEVSRFSQMFHKKHLINAIGGLTAHGLLLFLFLEVLVLGLFFVVYPLRRLSKEQAFPGAGRLRSGVLLYFAAIGFGFIVVEIVLSQKFVLFLGHPVYSLAVILFSVLLFSGIGAMLSSRMPKPQFATLVAAGLVLIPALLFQPVFEHCLAYSLPVRVLISVLLLAPVGLAMGVPFPVGIRLLGRMRPSLIPWAWAINGYTSVLGSVMAVMLSIELGFMAVLILATLTYALGVVGYRRMCVPDADMQPEASAAGEPDHQGEFVGGET